MPFTKTKRWLRLFEQDSMKFKQNFCLFSPSYYRFRWLDLSSLLVNLQRITTCTLGGELIQAASPKWALGDCSSEELLLE
jgi:hypothetical protein